ncbi:MAG: M20/M25/M40 family metallo-hydrolase [bacterium]
MPAVDIESLLDAVTEDALRGWVERLSVLRHGRLNYEALEYTGELIERHFGELGLAIRRDPFSYKGRRYFNVIATLPGQAALPGREMKEKGELPPFLAGAHYDAAAYSPGADDNASAVAALLIAAKALAGTRPRRTIRFVAFSIEEPQDAGDRRCRHGSRHFARRAFRRWERYAGVFILESVGYADPAPGSQNIPVRLPISVPDTGTFLGVVGNLRAREMIRIFKAAAERHAPGLEVLSHRFPLAGWLVPATRMSDHAPFWDRGYPAVMLTDTAFLRNPNYHRPTDTPGTLDYGFLANTTRALTAALAEG